MKHKGYEAVVGYDEDDRIFTGRVIDTQDVIAFDGASVAELETAFQAVIDEYLEDRTRIGKQGEFRGHNIYEFRGHNI